MLKNKKLLSKVRAVTDSNLLSKTKSYRFKKFDKYTSKVTIELITTKRNITYI